MELKFGAELALHPQCPPEDAAPCNRVVFRFVHESLEDERNFLCPAKLNPRRVFAPEKRCDSLALSLFSTEKKARQFYDSLRRNHQNIAKAIGTHLASGSIEVTDGRAGPERHDGHISLWESKDASISTRFNMFAALNT